MKIYTKRTRSSTSLRQSVKSLYMPLSHQISKELEIVVKDLETERRETNILEEQIEIAEKERLSQKTRVTATVNNQLTNDLLKIKISILEKELTKAQNKLNEACLENNELKEKINTNRLLQQNLKRGLFKVESDIKDTHQSVLTKTKHDDVFDLSQQKEISLLRSKSAFPRARTFDKSLTTTFLTERTNFNTKSSTIRSTDINFIEKVDRPFESLRIITLMKKMIENQSNSLKQKQKTLNSYTYHVDYLEYAFEQIRLTTGVLSVDEIATAFIKSENQRSTLHTYFNDLNIEIESLEKNLLNISNTIRDFKKSRINCQHKAALDKDQINTKVTDLKQKNIQILEEIRNIEAVYNVFEQDMKKIMSLCNLLSIETNSQFEFYDLDMKSEKNIRETLGLIEEFITSLVKSQQKLPL